MPLLKRHSTKSSSLNIKFARAKELLTALKLDGLVLEAPHDLFYWTGLHLSMGSLVFTSKEAHLYVDGRYFQSCKQKSDFDVCPQGDLVIPKGKIGFDSLQISYARYLALKKISLKSKTQLKAIPNVGQQLRLIKTEEEIAILREAGALTVRAMGYVKRLLVPGVTEKQIASGIDLFFKKYGASTAFSPIIAFGANSAMPHSDPTDQKLKKNDIALIDIGCKIEGYCSDMSRFFFIGKRRKEDLALYSAALAALEQTCKLVRPGTLSAALDQTARSAIETAGFTSYCHSLGHGVGIDIHEMPQINPKNKTPLEKNMVITIEPGVYMVGTGGVRLENQLLITNNGFENLTPFPFEKI